MEQSFEMPSKAKLIEYSIYAVIGIILLVFLVIVLKKIIRKFQSDSLVKESKQSVNKRNLTYDDWTYKQMAASLFEAFDGWGTTESVVYSNLRKLKNSDDWRKLISEYGIDKDNNSNLVQRLIYELDNSEIQKVNQILAKFNESI